MKAGLHRLLLVVIAGIAICACDTISQMEATAQLSRLPDSQCIVAALEEDSAVERAGIRNGSPYAVLRPDTPVRTDRPSWVHVELHAGPDEPLAGLSVVTRSWGMFGPGGSERRAWQDLLDRLRDRIVEHCSPSSADPELDQ